MKAYLVERPARDWCQDYAMVIIAEDERHAESRECPNLLAAIRIK